MRAMNLHKRRGAPVTTEEVRAEASGKSCCNGKGYVERVAPGAGPEAPRQQETCPCAQRAFLRRNPGIIMDEEGNAWWPDAEQPDPHSPPPLAPRARSQLEVAREAEEARKRAHLSRLREDLDVLRHRIEGLDHDIEALCHPELEQERALTRKLREIEAGHQERVDRLAALDLEIARHEEASREAVRVLEERMAELRARRARFESEAADDGAAAAEVRQAIEDAGEQVEAKARHLRKKQAQVAKEADQLARRIERISLRLGPESEGGAAA